MAGPNSVDRMNGLRVLAVDDEPDILETIVDVLDGATVTCARSYQDAVELLTPSDSDGPAERTFDVAVLDIMGVDGMELLTKTADLGIPTVMLTAHALNPQALRASIENGARSYLPKEELANLAEHINDVLEAAEQGQSTWERLFNRLGNFFEKAFAPAWKSDDPEFWASYYGSVM
jgi:CheY-like chemotaxis protein